MWAIPRLWLELECFENNTRGLVSPNLSKKSLVNALNELSLVY